MNFEDFISSCDKGFCLRNTIKSKNCKKEYKRKLCFNKYINKLRKKDETKNQVDELWLSVCEKVNERDGEKTCTIWSILTQEQKQFILEIYRDEYRQLGFTIDKAHIIPRSQSKEFYYEVENIINVSRYFHSLLDQYKHPVVRTLISKEERLEWMYRALSYSENKLKEIKNYGDSTQQRKSISKRKGKNSN